MADLLVVGTGLIGTSIAMVTTATGRDVVVADRSAEVQAVAVRRSGARAWDAVETAELAVVAIPPSLIGRELRRLARRDVARTYGHVSSVQAHVQREIETTDLAEIVCGGHPMAGREVAGPAGARADLFIGRPWVLCPGSRTSAEAALAMLGLATDCGAVPLVLSPQEHDRAVALVSHLPQIAASALAARLVGQDTWVSSLAGPGLSDTTRIAASDPSLWEDVLTLNAGRVAPLVRALGEELLGVAAALDEVAADRAIPDPPREEAARLRLVDVLRRGNAGRALVTGQRGLEAPDLASLAGTTSEQPT